MDDSFSNVEVKNGKVSQNGDSNVVIGYALPGIKESLNVKDSDFIDDLELPEDFEVTADVKDFKLDTAMTIVANAGSMISISASRSATLRREAPALVSVLDAALFEKTNASCLAQGLSFQPGVRVEDDCQNCGFAQVRINGLDGHYSQILVDSHPVFSALTGV